MSSLLTLKEGAVRAHVSFPTFRRWIDRGEISVVRIGRVVRVRTDDLQQFIDSRTIPAGTR
jgi:excisionase family DNA binding protein